MNEGVRKSGIILNNVVPILTFHVKNRRKIFTVF